jgi:hypothetical protein
MRVRGQAVMQFEQSARLCFASGLERAHTDVDVRHPEAWVVEDRRIELSIDGELGAADAAAYRRLLEALLDEAVGGFAVLELGTERWERRRGQGGSGAPRMEGSGAAPDPDDHPTIRAKVG